MVETEVKSGVELFPTDTPLPLITKTEVDRKAEEIREIRKLPKPPGKTISLEEGLEWFKLITKQEQWNHISIYLYRVFPVIIRQFADPEAQNYIDVPHEEAFLGADGFLGYMKRTHGGGRYKLMATDLDDKVARPIGAKGGAGSKPITEIKFEIPITDEMMPIVNYKELDTNDRKNYGYIQMLRNKGIINEKGERMAEIQVNSNAADVAGVMASQSDKAIQAVRDMSKENQALVREVLTAGKKDSGDKGVVELLLEKLKQDDPNKQITTMVALITALKDKPAPVEKHDSTTEIMKMIIQMQQDNSSKAMENQKFQMEMMMKITEAISKKPEADSILDKIIAYREILPGLFGSNNPSEPKTTTEVIVEKLSDIALPAIGLFSQMIQARTGATPIIPTNGQQAQETVRMMTGPRAVGPQLVQPSATPQVITQGPVSNPNENTSNSNNPQPNSSTSTTVPVQQQEVDIITRLLTTYGGLLITSIKSGATGEDLATQCITLQPMLGMDVYTMLCSKGKDELLNRMKSIPQFWNQTGLIFGDEHMNTLVEDFINGPDDGTDDNEDDGKGEGA
jgi:hypothetical protein